MSGLHPEADIKLRLSKGAANDPKRTYGERVVMRQFKQALMAGWLLAVALAGGVVFGGSLALADDENAQDNADKHDPWAAHRLLPGTWEAKIDGRLGQGTGYRQYEFIFDDQFLVGRHASIRLPQELSPKGDYHRELSVYSFDSERDTIVLRQFIVEGYVLQFTCEKKPMRFDCVTEHIENGSGISARMTVEFESPYRFSETFELTESGKESQIYFTNTWTRVPSLED
jgi:hypothetical protein